MRPAPAGDGETAWSVRLRATGATGAVPVVLRAIYPDGRSVEVDQQLTVVPAAEVRLPVAGGRGRHLPRGRRRRRRPLPRAPQSLIASLFVLFRQFVDDDLGCASYLVGDEEAGVAAIVDPLTRSSRWWRRPRGGASGSSARSRPTRTPTTPSGHGRLALEHGIPISIHPAAEAEYAHDRCATARRWSSAPSRCGRSTPGHRPEHTCLAVIDRSRAEEPWLVLTGDSLFVGDVARPDLAVAAKEGAEGLSTRCSCCSSSRTVWSSSPATSPARSAARR